MTHRGLRAFLVVIAFAATAGAGYALWTLDGRHSAQESSARTFDAAAVRALVLVERFRAAQQSYVADGQGREFWMRRASEVLEELDRSLTTLAGTTAMAELRDAARGTAAPVEELRRMDARAIEWLRHDQALMASDLIFTESLAVSGSLADRLAVIRARHDQLAEAERANMREQQLYVLGGAVAICLIVMLLLAPAVRLATPQDTREALRALIGGPATTPAVRPESAPRMSGTNGSGALTVASGQPPTAIEPPRVVIEAATPIATPAAGRTEPPAPAIDVPGAARVCADLARVIDPADLPGLLARSAELLHARGLIVWVADGTGTVLYPMVAHGYSPGVMARMGSIRRDDDNAAAAAFRRSEVSVVPAVDGEPGAIVTPIVAPDGCVGVLAAEVEAGGEDNADRRALAGILAAQLATLVTVLPAPEQRAMQAQG